MDSVGMHMLLCGVRASQSVSAPQATGKHLADMPHTLPPSLYPPHGLPSVWPNLPTPSTHYIECVCISKLDRKKYAQGKVLLTFTVAVYIFAFCLTL